MTLPPCASCRPTLQPVHKSTVDPGPFCPISSELRDTTAHVTWLRSRDRGHAICNVWRHGSRDFDCAVFTVDESFNCLALCFQHLLHVPDTQQRTQSLKLFKRLCIFGPKGAVQIRYYYSQSPFQRTQSIHFGSLISTNRNGIVRQLKCVNSVNNNNKKLSYCKQIARQLRTRPIVTPWPWNRG